jgi:hypothetical protein
MRILMTGSDAGAGARVETLLRDAGHEVVSCTGPDRPFPCRGVASGTCPLDEGAAVAVSAPASIPPEPRAEEIGVICALRRHLPLLVVAPDDVAWSEARLGSIPIDDLLDEVERAAAAPLPAHTEAVRAEVQRALGPGADAAVFRSGTGLVVTIDVPAGTEERRVEAAAVRAQGAVRSLDPFATVVDVRTQEA